MKKLIIAILFVVISSSMVFSEGDQNNGSTGSGTTTTGTSSQGSADQNRSGR